MRCLPTWLFLIAAGFCLTPMASGQTAAGSHQEPVRRMQPVAPAAAVENQVKPLADPSTLDRVTVILNAWEAESKRIQTLQVDFDRIDHQTKLGDMAYRYQALFKSPDLARLECKKAVLGDNGLPKTSITAEGKVEFQFEQESSQQCVWTGKELLQYELT